jgi:hypothetical protein
MSTRGLILPGEGISAVRKLELMTTEETPKSLPGWSWLVVAYISLGSPPLHNLTREQPPTSKQGCLAWNLI